MEYNIYLSRARSAVWWILPVVLFVVIISTCTGTPLTDKQCFINACNYTHPGLQCPRGHVILITNVSCMATEKHECPKQLYLDVLNKCSGRHRCSLRLLALEKLQGICRKGPRVSATFTCIRKPSHQEHKEACTGANRLSKPHGFVYSPGYPKRYSQTPCWWKLFLDRDQDVLFTIFEMQSFFGGSPHDMPDFLRVSPTDIAPSCPLRRRDVVSFQEFRGDVLSVKQFRVRCHREAEIALRQLSGAGKGVRLMLFYQVIPADSQTTELLPSFLARSCVTPDTVGRSRSFEIPVRKPVVTQSIPTTITSPSPGPAFSSTKPASEVNVTETYDSFLGLVIGLVLGGLLSISLVVCIALYCLRRKRAKSAADYNSFSEGKSGSTAGFPNSESKGKVCAVTSVGGHRDMSSGYASDSDSAEEYDLPNNPTYESIEKYRLSDTYCRVADEITCPPPAPKPIDERENLDSVSATYAEIQSILDERIPPQIPVSYREFLRRQLAALENNPTASNVNSGPYAVSGYLCGELDKDSKVPPKVPPKSPGMLAIVKGVPVLKSDAQDSQREVTPAEPIYSHPSNQEQSSVDVNDIVFVDNELYQPSSPT